MSFEQVKIEGAKVLLIFAGKTGCGKTYSALQVAKGLAGGDMGAVGFLDTENGRGRLYTNKFPTPYLYSELKAPFSPARFIQKVEEAEKMGIKVLIIDSFSHEWDNVGGCRWIAENTDSKLANWNKAKAEHQKLMNKLLTANCHIILCIRGKDNIKPETVNGKMVYVNHGFKMITEKDVAFEATAALQIDNSGLVQRSLKTLPTDIIPILGRGDGYLTEEDGMALDRWITGSDPMVEVEKMKATLSDASYKGVNTLKAVWQSTPAYIRYLMGGECPSVFKQQALEVDNGQKVKNVLDGNPEKSGYNESE
jgi:hypothetical protein